MHLKKLNPIGTQTDYNMEPEAFPRTEHLDDLLFRETDAHGNASLLNHSWPETSQPMSITSSTRRRKRKAKRKANTKSDAIHEWPPQLKMDLKQLNPANL